MRNEYYLTTCHPLHLIHYFHGHFNVGSTHQSIYRPFLYTHIKWVCFKRQFCCITNHPLLLNILQQDFFCQLHSSYSRCIPKRGQNLWLSCNPSMPVDCSILFSQLELPQPTIKIDVVFSTPMTSKYLYSSLSPMYQSKNPLVLFKLLFESFVPKFRLWIIFSTKVLLFHEIINNFN